MKHWYCRALGHKWGGWRRSKVMQASTRRCRRCGVVQTLTDEAKLVTGEE